MWEKKSLWHLFIVFIIIITTYIRLLLGPWLSTDRGRGHSEFTPRLAKCVLRSDVFETAHVLMTTFRSSYNDQDMLDVTFESRRQSWYYDTSSHFGLLWITLLILYDSTNATRIIIWYYSYIQNSETQIVWINTSQTYSKYKLRSILEYCFEITSIFSKKTVI